MISECTFDLSLQKVHYYLLFINYRVERSFADALIFFFSFYFLASPRILFPKQGVLEPLQEQHQQ